MENGGFMWEYDMIKFSRNANFLLYLLFFLMKEEKPLNIIFRQCKDSHSENC